MMWVQSITGLGEGELHREFLQLWSHRVFSYAPGGSPVPISSPGHAAAVFPRRQERIPKVPSLWSVRRVWVPMSDVRVLEMCVTPPHLSSLVSVQSSLGKGAVLLPGGGGITA